MHGTNTLIGNNIPTDSRHLMLSMRIEAVIQVSVMIFIATSQSVQVESWAKGAREFSKPSHQKQNSS